MSSQTSQQPPLSLVVRLGAERGMIVSLPLIMASAAFFFSLDVAELSLLVGPALLAEAILWPFLMRRMLQRFPGLANFSSLWTVGVIAFLGGSLICALFSAVMLIWVKPGFIQAYMAHCLSLADECRQIGLDPAMLSDAMKYKLIPSGMEFVESMFWSSAFFGSMYSMLVAALLPGISRKLINNKIE